jgi:flagellar motor switch protein FliG
MLVEGGADGFQRSSEVTPRPFDYINQQSSELIWECLKDELPHSQVLTVIITYLKQPLREEFWSKLPDDFKIDLMDRLKKFKTISPDVLREIERVLERKISMKLEETR